MAGALGNYRRGHVVRLRLYARGPKAARFAAATHRCASSSSRAITRKNIRPNIFDRQKHGWPDWLSCIAGGKSHGPDLPRISALCDGRPNKITRQSSARTAKANSVSFRERVIRFARSTCSTKSANRWWRRIRSIWWKAETIPCD